MIGECSVVGCFGPRGSNPYEARCLRHQRNPDAPPMKVTCECASPDIEKLTAYGANAAQCRRCGSPIEGTLMVDISP